jgi:hypothetical protein
MPTKTAKIQKAKAFGYHSYAGLFADGTPFSYQPDPSSAHPSRSVHPGLLNRSFNPHAAPVMGAPSTKIQ